MVELRRTWLLICIGFDIEQERKLLENVSDRIVIGFHDPKKLREFDVEEEGYNPFFEKELKELEQQSRRKKI